MAAEKLDIDWKKRVADAIFTGPTPDKLKMILGLVTYILFFSGNHMYLPWIWIPMDFIIVGGGLYHVVCTHINPRVNTIITK